MFKKCMKCGQVVKVIKGNSNIICCSEEMKEVKANSVDASFEKHIPEYEINGNKIIVRVNHVMESEHFIEWIAIENEKEFNMKRLSFTDKCEVEFDFIPNSVVYSYCNKHGLWKKEVE